MKALLSKRAGQAALQSRLWQALVMALHMLSIQQVACDVGSIAEQPAPMLGSLPAAAACGHTARLAAHGQAAVELLCSLVAQMLSICSSVQHLCLMTASMRCCRRTCRG